MSKRIKVIVSVVAVILALSIVGTTATVMAQDEEPPTDETQPGMTQEELYEALNTALTDAVAQGLITQEQADKILERWERMEQLRNRWEEARGRIRRGIIFGRLLKMDEDELGVWLQENVEDGEQAGQIKEKWEEARGKIRRGLVFKRMMGMSEEELDEALATAVEENRITGEQAEQLKARWQQGCEALESDSTRARISRALRSRHMWGGHGGWCWPRLPESGS